MRVRRPWRNRQALSLPDQLWSETKICANLVAQFGPTDRTRTAAVSLIRRLPDYALLASRHRLEQRAIFTGIRSYSCERTTGRTW